MSSTKTAIVTGSSSGIGLDIAQAFLERGDNVVLNGRDAGKLADTSAKLAAAQPDADEHIAAVPGSIAHPSTGRALVRAAVERFGRVDVLVNNAGIFGVKPFVDVTEEDLDAYLGNNLKGTYLTTQAVVRQMTIQPGGGSIVNIGTVLVDHAVSGLPASAPIISKAGVQALTISLAAELAPAGIRVNMVAPGMIRTPLHAAWDVDQFAGLALLNRVGDVTETSAAVLCLADATFTTGHVLRVDGGFVTGRA